MKAIYAFLLGAWEFRSDLTTNPGDDLNDGYGVQFASYMTIEDAIHALADHLGAKFQFTDPEPRKLILKAKPKPK